MGKSQETWNKKEREKQKQKARKEKEERKKERKENSKSGDLKNMMAYVDEIWHLIQEEACGGFALGLDCTGRSSRGNPIASGPSKRKSNLLQ